MDSTVSLSIVQVNTISTIERAPPRNANEVAFDPILNVSLAILDFYKILKVSFKALIFLTAFPTNANSITLFTSI